jgi:hypothetical protein
MKAFDTYLLLLPSGAGGHDRDVYRLRVLADLHSYDGPPSGDNVLAREDLCAGLPALLPRPLVDLQRLAGRRAAPADVEGVQGLWAPGGRD